MVDVLAGEISKSMTMLILCSHFVPLFRFFPQLLTVCLSLPSVVLDTNVWYHQTLIIGDEVSITIGAEYD